MYNSHINEFNEKMNIYDVKMDNELSKLATITEMVNIKTEQTYRDIETRIILEDGTDEDLEYLREEAETEVINQKKGILKKIFEWFKNIFKAIRAKFDKIFKKGKKDSSIKYNISIKIKGDIKQLDDYYKAIQQSLSQMNRGNFEEAALQIAKVDAPDIMENEKTDTGEAATEITDNERDAMLDDLADKANTVEKVVDATESKITNEDDLEKVSAATTVLQKLQNFLSAISRVVTHIAGLTIAKVKTLGENIRNKVSSIRNNNDDTTSDNVEESYYDYDNGDYSIYL